MSTQARARARVFSSHGDLSSPPVETLPYEIVQDLDLDRLSWSVRVRVSPVSRCIGRSSMAILETKIIHEYLR